MGLQHLSHRDQRQDHGRRLEVKLMHVGHDALQVAVHLSRRHGKQGVQAVAKGRRRSKGHQRIHIGRSVDQAFKSADKKLLVDHHDDSCQQKLGNPYRHVIFCQRRRKRPVPHHMSHRQIHQRNQETKRSNQPAPDLRRLRVLQKIIVCGSGRSPSPGTRAGDSACCPLHRGAVARRLHSGDDGRLVRRALHAHGIRKKTYGTGGHARHLRHGLFHSRAAGRAAHTCHIVLFHNLSSSIASASAAPSPARRWSRPFPPGYPLPRRSGYGWPAEPC